ncbi:MAG: response regulator, partial [Actinomycetota bacterium]|nr:response regulator [Actinomycetota bacterium]
MHQLSLEAESEFLLARQNEARFLESWSRIGFDAAFSDHVTANRRHLGEARSRLTQLQRVSETSDDPQVRSIRNLSTKLLPLLNSYETAFRATVDNVNEISGSGGLENRLRSELDRLERELAPNPSLKEFVLRMQANEQAYFASGRLEFAEKARLARDQLKAAIRNRISGGGGPRGTSREGLIARVDHNFSTFDTFVALDQEVETNSAIFRDLTDDITSLTNQIGSRSQDGLEKARERLESVNLRSLVSLTATGVLTLVLAILIALALARRTIRPLQELSSAATQIGEGDLDRALRASGPQEFRTLAEVLDSMRVRLKDLIGSLEQRVAERTERLQQTTTELHQAKEAAESEAMEKAKLADEAERRKRYFESLLEVSPTAIVTTDLDGNVTSWNPAAEKLFGYSQPEALARNIDDLLCGPEELREEGESRTQQARGEGYVHAITRRVRKDGSLVDVELLVAPVVMAEEQVGSYAIYHDITELQRARREANAATEAKSAFLATMSHEIRTPMNAVIGMTGLLLDTELSAEQRSYAEIIQSSGDALLSVINDILDFSKIEAGKLEIEMRAFNLRDCIESSLELVAMDASHKGLDLAYLLDPNAPVAVVGDLTRLRQILVNLLNNAVKFTEKGEVVVSVEPEPLVSGEAPTNGRQEKRCRLHFNVRDTGIGIPEHRMDRLFESFSQVDASTTRRYGGTGLGLAISKRLSELMGGTMWAESEVGKGSTFHFTIEAQVAERPAPAYVSATPGQLDGRRALIVDDNATNRYILVRQVEAWGMRARETGSATEALEWIRRGDPFDVAILDMQMPEIDGITLAREIRRHRDPPTLPLVMLTSLGRRREEAEADVDFAAYLTKPIKPSQLYDTLMGVFGEQTALLAAAASEVIAEPHLAQRAPLRILLAEDNQVNQQLALLLLKKVGYSADVANNGVEALAALERKPYDVVLMDVQMPEMDGLEATRRIHQRWSQETRPRVIAVTANAMREEREACFAAGMGDYLSKPIRLEELTAALARSRPLEPLRPPQQRDLRERPSGSPGIEMPSESAHNAATGGQEEQQRDEGPLDPQALERLLASLGEGAERFIGELIEAFIVDAHETLVTLRKAIEEQSAEDLRRAAHTLKSNAASFGARALEASCRQLEAMGKEGRLA